MLYGNVAVRRRQWICIGAVAGREAVQHADSDAGWRLGGRDSGLDLDLKTIRVRLRVGVRVRLGYVFCCNQGQG